MVTITFMRLWYLFVPTVQMRFDADARTLPDFYYNVATETSYYYLPKHLNTWTLAATRIVLLLWIWIYALNPFACHGIYLYDNCDARALFTTLLCTLVRILYRELYSLSHYFLFCVTFSRVPSMLYIYDTMLYACVSNFIVHSRNGIFLEKTKKHQ